MTFDNFYLTLVSASKTDFLKTINAECGFLLLLIQ